MPREVFEPPPFAVPPQAFEEQMEEAEEEEASEAPSSSPEGKGSVDDGGDEPDDGNAEEDEVESLPEDNDEQEEGVDDDDDDDEAEGVAPDDDEDDPRAGENDVAGAAKNDVVVRDEEAGEEEEEEEDGVSAFGAAASSAAGDDDEEDVEMEHDDEEDEEVEVLAAVVVAGEDDDDEEESMDVDPDEEEEEAAAAVVVEEVKKKPPSTNPKSKSKPSSASSSSKTKSKSKAAPPRPPTTTSSSSMSAKKSSSNSTSNPKKKKKSKGSSSSAVASPDPHPRSATPLGVVASPQCLAAARDARAALQEMVPSLPYSLAEIQVRSFGRLPLDPGADGKFATAGALFPVGFSCDRFEFSPVHGRVLRVRCSILDGRRVRKKQRACGVPPSRQVPEGPIFRLLWGQAIDEDILPDSVEYPYSPHAHSAPLTGDPHLAVAVAVADAPTSSKSSATSSLIPERGMRVKVRYDRNQWHPGTIARSVEWPDPRGSKKAAKSKGSKNSKSPPRKRYKLSIRYDDGSREELVYPDPDVSLLLPGTCSWLFFICRFCCSVRMEEDLHSSAFFGFVRPLSPVACRPSFSCKSRPRSFSLRRRRRCRRQGERRAHNSQRQVRHIRVGSHPP